MIRSPHPRFAASALILSLGFIFNPLHAQAPGDQPSTYTIAPSDEVQFQLQGRLIDAIPGDVIQLEEGVYQLRRQLDVVADNLTIRGRGSDKTILSFSKQDTGSQGIEATGNNLVLEHFAVEDTVGNAIKVLAARNVTFRNVRVQWTGPPAATNGAYGLYPVQCRNVLIEQCTAIGASDAGLYVGQCRNVVVRSSRAERNVAGIEIENTIDADVYDNIATNNAGGILVFDLPGLPQKAGGNVRVFGNEVVANNHRNFAAPGNVVAGVPPGTGLMIMATDRVEVFDNEIKNNHTSSVSIVSFQITGTKITDPDYDPISESVSIHDNRISSGGQRPQGAIRLLLTPVLGSTFPDILYDGAIDPARLVDGALPAELRHSIKNNGAATYANFNLPLLSPRNVLTGKFKVERDLAAVAHDLAPLPPVTLRPHDAPTPNGSAAVRAYRAAPTKLSAYGLFKGNGSTQQPVEGVVPYDLNAALFSDYATKRRFIRIPNGTHITYKDQAVLDFPVGTVMAKTFSYPHDMRDSSKGERLLETRIETRREDGWYGYSYLWNDEQTEATLALGGGERHVSWIHGDGSPRSNEYQIPNANQCLNCHNQDKQFVPLGPFAANLNRDFPFGHGAENQLDYLDRLGLLHGKPPTDTIAELSRYDDPASGTLDDRARAWLHVNCAHCHSPLGTARTSGLDLRLSQQDAGKFGVWKSPIAAGHGTGGREYDIVPGKPDKSIMLFRLESTDPSVMMPNVSKRLVSTEGVALLRDWIGHLEE